MHYDFNPKWHAPTTVEDALNILDKDKTDTPVILAGGTDLTIRIRDGQVVPRSILDITRIEGLDTISHKEWISIIILPGMLELNDSFPEDRSFIVIGATATMDGISRSVLLRSYLPSVVKAAGEIGSPLIRNAATIGGNVMNASPAADMATMLLAQDTRAVLLSLGPARILPLNDLFTGVCKTCIESNELLAYFLLRPPSPYVGTGFYKLKRREALALAVVNSGAVLRSDGKRITDASLSIGAVAVTPLLIDEIKKILRGKKIDEAEACFNEVAELARDLSRPISDVRGSEEYRKEMVRVCALRSLGEAFNSLKRDVALNHREVD
ncbi:MAG: FAD binding domain-containing protein [Candidatus Thermoplasmatota archaeon]|nr:FAD binding domain-containing protein [Candidatus Thermoplasmatota archaeon]MDP7266296.1 FAD binding domain-containing protein [Candidatus Thermoplasmatota archaeon]